VVSLELERRSTLAEGLVKSITGGDRISARYLYGQRFDFEPTHTVVLVTNHLPRVRGTDEAFSGAH
jgi:putative DNA primase/helicase